MQKFMYKYIDKSIFKWMLDARDPDIRYLTLIEFPDGEIDTNLNQEYQNLEYSFINSPIFKNRINNVVGDNLHFDLLYKGTIWQFAEIVERGLDIRNDCVKITGDYIIKKLQLPSGGFSVNWDPPLEAAGWTGNILYYLLKSNYEKTEIHNAAKWIAQEQRHDGGWRGLPLQKISDYIKFLFFGKSSQKNKNVKSKSCLFASVFCLAALVEYFKKYGQYKENIISAVNFILGFNFFDKKILKTAGDYIKNKNILNLGYPLVSQLDILKILVIISQAGCFNHPKVDRLFNLILQKRNSNGSWNYESRAAGMLDSNNDKILIGKPNKWVTLNALRLMKYAEK